MRPYHLSDFYKNNAWLICRFDTQVKDQPIDVYLMVDLPSSKIIVHKIIETTITQAETEQFLQEASEKTKKTPGRIILATGDPIEPFICDVAKKLGVGFEVTSAIYLEEIIAPLKKFFGEHFFSISAMHYGEPRENEDEADIMAAKQSIPDSYDPCPCASGKKYKFCCKKIFREITEAMVAAEDGKISEALEWINKAKSIVGETPEVLCREAIVYSFADREKSAEVLAKCLAANPNHPRAHYIHAITLKENGDIDGAIKSYETAISNYLPSDHYHLNEVYNNLGVLFYDKGEYAKAKAAWEKALLYLPSDKLTRQNLERLIYKKPIG